MVPTAHKEKLPKGFSYPLGAQAICDALDGVPQFANAKLWFKWRDEYWASEWRKRLEARGSITLFDVSYADYLGYWAFRIYSVPSDHSVFARNLLLRELAGVRRELLRAGVKSKRYRAVVKLSLSEAEAAANTALEPTPTAP